MLLTLFAAVAAPFNGLTAANPQDTAMVDQAPDLGIFSEPAFRSVSRLHPVRLSTLHCFRQLVRNFALLSLRRKIGTLNSK